MSDFRIHTEGDIASRVDRDPTGENVLNPYFTDERLLKNAVVRAEQAEATIGWLVQMMGGDVLIPESMMKHGTLLETYRNPEDHSIRLHARWAE